MRVLHLIRRTAHSLWPSLSPNDLHLVHDVLSEEELVIWSAMQVADRAHSVKVLRRLDEQIPSASHTLRCAALLHDVGKSVARLSTVGRITATLFGPRTTRMRAYLAHEAIGARMLEGVSDPMTVALVSGKGPEDLVAALRRADDV